MIITAGIYKGRKITAPDENVTRPTLSKTRMGIFNTLYSVIGDFEGKTFLDVFGGSGIMGLEALSRGFKEVKVFELNRRSADIIKKNYSSVGLKANLTVGDSLKLLSKSEEVFDVVYVDPPYQSGIYEKVLKLITGGIVIVEYAGDVDFTGFNILKQKAYGSTKVAYLSQKSE